MNKFWAAGGGTRGNVVVRDEFYKCAIMRFGLDNKERSAGLDT